jgi:hypothetical protein
MAVVTIATVPPGVVSWSERDVARSEATETRGIAIFASVDPREYREIPSAL